MQQRVIKYKKKEQEMEQVNQQLRNEVERLIQEKQDLGVDNLSMKEQILKMKEEEKEREEELKELRREVKRLKLQQLDESKYIQWGPEEITAWIVNLDTNRMQKYDTVLGKGLVENEVNGALLAEVDGGDLNQWGIGDRKDRKYVMAQIERLVANNAPNQSAKPVMMEGANAAPTAYM